MPELSHTAGIRGAYHRIFQVETRLLVDEAKFPQFIPPILFGPHDTYVG